jgi:formate-dependent nitrite reductase membrane component NrfD
MGENKHIKELDAFAKKYVKEIPSEKLSLDFTASLMKKIALENNSEVFKAKPLIAKKGWVFIVASIVALVFVSFFTTKESTFNLPKIEFDFLEQLQFTNLFDTISVSNITLYAVLFFGLLFFAQIIFLKKHFDKRVY